MDSHLQIPGGSGGNGSFQGMINGGIGVNNNASEDGIFNEVLYVKVMTDEQLEILRTQIAVYATICDQLVEMHKAFSSQQDLAGARLGNLYCDPLVTAVGHKFTVRQRWTPTAIQLEILEDIFKQGSGTPSKQKIKEITADLSQHGQISETNVYNWFQNRRARSKKKQQLNNGESEVETDGESPKDKKKKPENSQSQQNSASKAEDLCFQGQEMSSNMHSLDPKSGKRESVFVSDGCLEPSQTFDVNQLAFYESVLQNSRMDQLIGKMELPGPGDYNAYQPTDRKSVV